MANGNRSFHLDFCCILTTVDNRLFLVNDRPRSVRSSCLRPQAPSFSISAEAEIEKLGQYEDPSTCSQELSPGSITCRAVITTPRLGDLSTRMGNLRSI